MAATGEDTKHIQDEIIRDKQNLSEYEKRLNDLESVTDKGAQRKYATVLNLGIDPKSKLQWLNPAANTEAAKNIRKEAKKSSDDKNMDQLKKLIKKASGEETAPASPAPVATPPPVGGGVLL